MISGNYKSMNRHVIRKIHAYQLYYPNPIFSYFTTSTMTFGIILIDIFEAIMQLDSLNSMALKHLGMMYW